MDLPPEICDIIISHLDYCGRDQQHLAQTCSEWRDLVAGHRPTWANVVRSMKYPSTELKIFHRAAAAICGGDIAEALHGIAPWIGQFYQPLFDKFVEYRIVLPFDVYARLVATDPDRALALWWREGIEQYSQIPNWRETPTYREMIAAADDPNNSNGILLIDVFRLHLFHVAVNDSEAMFVWVLQGLWKLPAKILKHILSSPYIALLVNCANIRGHAEVIDITTAVMQHLSIPPIKDVDLMAMATTDAVARAIINYCRGTTSTYYVLHHIMGGVDN